MVDHGKYMVKVSIQSNNLILGTGLAAAETVEKAEDQARQRAIASLDLAKKITISVPSKHPPVKEQNLASVSPSTPTNISSPLTHPSTVSKTEVIRKSSPVLETEITIFKHPPVVPEHQSQATSEVYISEQSTIINPPEKTNLDASAIDKQTIIPIPDEDNLPSHSEIEPITSPPELELSSITEDTPLLNNLTSEQPEKTANSATMDFSQIINQTTIELKRLGWTQEDGKKYLLATYGKKSRHLLSDEELIEFLNYLQTLEAKS
jgi:hypothetical protein